MSEQPLPKGRYVLSRRDLIRLTAGSSIGLAIAAACQPTTGPSQTGAPGASAAPKFGGTAVINQGTDPDTLLSYAAGTVYAGNIIKATANGLTYLQIPEMSPAADLAESWTVSPDGKVFTFKLRKGVKWHDGEPFTAQDVKFTFEVLVSPDRAGPLPANLSPIEGAAAVKNRSAKEISGFKILDPDTVQFTLTDPSPLFLVTAATSIIYPQHVLKDINVADLPKSPFARKPIGTGPFMVSEWRTGDQVILKAFPDHFRGRPKLDSIVSRAVQESATALAELRAGGVQLQGVSADQFPEFEKDTATYTTQRLPGTTAWYWQMDLTNPLFTDLKVRQAISYAVNRKAVVDALFSGAGEPNYSLVSPLSWIYNANTPKFEFNQDKAKQLLDDAGWKPGPDGIRVKDGKKFAFKMMASPRTSPWAIAFQPNLKAVGIDMQIELLEFATIVARSTKPNNYDMFFQGWGNFTVDPRTDLSANFLSPRAPDSSGYKNSKVDDLFTQARKTIDDATQKTLYQQIQMITETEVPYIHLFRTQDLLVTRNSLSIPKLKIANQLWLTVRDWEVR